MIGVDEAIRILADAAEPREPVEVPVERANRLGLAEDVLADRDFPAADRSAMDGFAVRSSDVRAPVASLRIVGEIPAGSSADGVSIGPGDAVRLYTGAVLPQGADAVVMVEHTREDRDRGVVRIDAAVEAGENVRRQGSDCKQGERVLEAGAPIHAPELAALASVGRSRVWVHRPPVAHVVSTGDELVEPGETPAPHQIRESNGRMLVALLAEIGIRSQPIGRAGDRPDALARALETGLGADILLVSGGVSVGTYDLVAETLRASGAEILFHGVAMKPGKPVLAARRGTTLVVGLPGNPVSAYVGFCVLVAPALRRMLGYRGFATPEIDAVLLAPLEQRPGRETFHLARIEARAGRFEAAPIATTGSGDVLALARANGLLRLPATASRIEAGRTVRALVWRDAAHR